MMRARLRSRSARVMSVWARAMVGMGRKSGVRDSGFGAEGRGLDSLPEGVAAVDDEGGAGHVGGGFRGEVDGEGAELLGLAVAAHGDLLLEGFDDFRVDLFPAEI